MGSENQYYQTNFDLFTGGEVSFSSQPVSAITEEPTENSLPRGEKTEGYGIYIFTKPIPERQTSRCYYIVYQPSLWDQYTVQRQWGWLGSEKQQFYVEHFRSPRPALRRIRRLIDRRLRRGYRLSHAA